MTIYFIQAGDTPLVKIGRAKNVRKRRNNLQFRYSEKLRILATIAADDGMETKLHARFYDYREEGEWFRLEGALKEYLETGIYQDLPEPEPYLDWHSTGFEDYDTAIKRYMETLT